MGRLRAGAGTAEVGGSNPLRSTRKSARPGMFSMLAPMTIAVDDRAPVGELCVLVPGIGQLAHPFHGRSPVSPLLHQKSRT
jgi:hypothetical protein